MISTARRSTQREFAESWGQKAKMVTSFADGTKLSLEMTLVANATGFRVARRGMLGTPLRTRERRSFALRARGASRGRVSSTSSSAQSPAPARSSSRTTTHPERRHMMRYFKIGDGPFYVFYQPWHLPHLEAPSHRGPRRPLPRRGRRSAWRPRVRGGRLAKRDLDRVRLDGIGGFSCYGRSRTRTPRGQRTRAHDVGPGCRCGGIAARDRIRGRRGARRPSRRRPLHRAAREVRCARRRVTPAPPSSGRW